MPLKKSWVDGANAPDCPFPLNNLPCGVYSVDRSAPRLCVAIGDRVLDLAKVGEAGLIEGRFARAHWNAHMVEGPPAWAKLRARLTELLAEDGDPALRKVEGTLVPLADVRLHMPFRVAEYTDFYAGRNHAFNVGSMFRGPENALPPNWEHIPIGYNGRASSVVVSGSSFHRPWGQIKPHGEDAPRFAQSRRFDFELEMGAVVGTGSTLGRPVSVAQADEMVFGYVLLNDWSARDIQAWEYQPLGPFQAKATATTISPWIVSKSALEPFRCEGMTRNRPLMPYLQEPRPGLYDVKLEVSLTPEEGTPTTITRTNYREMYYSAAQQLAHHSISGCAMNSGDLLGSGTISGASNHERGSLLELSWGGKEPLTLTGGEKRSFLEDNDTITMTGWAEGDGYRVGFGDCTGTVMPAIEQPDWTRE